MTHAHVAYFSMEVELDPEISTYAGGLGILAGDTLRAAADQGLPLVGVSLVHRQGYFRQHLSTEGEQTESPDPWSPELELEEMAPRATIELEGRALTLRAWRYVVRGSSGAEVPVYLLDAALPENAAEHRGLTDHLYGGDARYRLCQEVILGVGGIAMLDALEGQDIRLFHMNEGHSALLTLPLIERERTEEQVAVRIVRERCVFTTHTPVPAGHDQFPLELVRSVLGEERAERLRRVGCCLDSVLNLTHVALFLSHYVNGVAMRHWQVSRGMFPGYPIASITNGVHAGSWVARPFRQLFDRHIPDWRLQNDNLRYAVYIPHHEIRAAHIECKSDLLAEVQRRSGVRMRREVMTLGFARRAALYKRAELLLSDVDRLRRIAAIGEIQIIYAGKAHPHDGPGKAMIRRVFEQAARLRGCIEIVYLEDYDAELGRLLCAGVDLWINTPQKPEEASGTSGMKAALNGVPSLSVLDGWWVEGHVEGITGWSIGDSWDPTTDIERERDALYRKLESIVTLYYGKPDAYDAVMRHAIALNGSFFNAERMIQQYAHGAYRIRSSVSNWPRRP